MVSAARLCGGVGEHEVMGENTSNLLHPSKGCWGSSSLQSSPGSRGAGFTSPPGGRQGGDAQGGSAPGITEDAQGKMLKNKTPWL